MEKPPEQPKSTSQTQYPLQTFVSSTGEKNVVHVKLAKETERPMSGGEWALIIGGSLVIGSALGLSSDFAKATMEMMSVLAPYAETTAQIVKWGGFVGVPTIILAVAAGWEARVREVARLRRRESGMDRLQKK